MRIENAIFSPLKGVLVSVGHVQDIHQTLVSYMTDRGLKNMAVLLQFTLLYVQRRR